MSNRGHENGRLQRCGEWLIRFQRRLATCTLTATALLPLVSPALSRATGSRPLVGGQTQPAPGPAPARMTTTGSFTLVELLRPELVIGNSPTFTRSAAARASGDRVECTNHGPPLIGSLSRDVGLRRRLYWPIVRSAECRHGLPRGLLDALILAESAYRADARSRVGARGLAQLMPATARSLGLVDHFDPAGNIDGGARYLRAMIEGFGGSIALGLAAYNAGPFAVRRTGGIPRNGETPAYVERVMRYWDEANKAVEMLAPPAQRTVHLITFSKS